MWCKNLVKWQIFRNFIVENQIVMNKIMPLDQDRSIDANALNHTAKVQNRFVKPGSIMEKLMDFAAFRARFSQDRQRKHTP